jgi:hypothetical protein
MHLDKPIPEQLVPGGVGRVADLGSEGSKRKLGGQDDFDRDDPQMGTHVGGGERQHSENLVAEGKRRNLTIIKVTNIHHCYALLVRF